MKIYELTYVRISFNSFDNYGKTMKVRCSRSHGNVIHLKGLQEVS